MFFLIVLMQYKPFEPYHLVLLDLHLVYYIKLCILQMYLENRQCTWFIQHMSSHSGLPGPLSLGSAQIDKLIAVATPCKVIITQAKVMHSKFHMSSSSLHTLFPQLSKSSCKHLVRSCTKCGPLLPLGPLQQQGVNPGGLKPNSIWQMDVTISHHLENSNLYMLWWIHFLDIYLHLHIQEKKTSYRHLKTGLFMHGSALDYQDR